MNNGDNDDHNKLLSQLRELTIKELFMKYIEAKIGPQEKRDWLPLWLWDLIEVLGDKLNKLYGNKTIELPFKKY